MFQKFSECRDGAMVTFVTLKSPDRHDQRRISIYRLYTSRRFDLSSVGATINDLLDPESLRK